MADLAVLLLVSTSITLIVVQGSLFDALRARGPALWRELLRCPLCLGVWVGAALWAAVGALGGDFAPELAQGPWGWRAAGAASFGAVTGVAALTLRRIWDALDNVGE